MTYQLDNGETYTIPIPKPQDIYVKINNAKETMYTDQTSAFPVSSKKENKYIMILCGIVNDVIMCEAMRNISSDKIVQAY